jgi:hypothetical protein
VRARCVNSGQSCIAAKRFLIADAIYDEFETRFVAGMDAMKIGDPTREDTEIGPLATAAQVDDVHAQVQAAIQAGGRLLTGGERMIGKGSYYEPTVIAGVPRTAAVCREEIFGPVAMLFRVSATSTKPSLWRTTLLSAWAPRCGRAVTPSSDALPPHCKAVRSSSTRPSPAIHACPSEASSAPATVANSPPPACANSSTPRPSSSPNR